MSTWGMHTIVDLIDCNYEAIRSEQCIRSYIDLLVEMIDMKKEGDGLILNFGDNEFVTGWTCYQPIQTSGIQGHFINATNDACIDVFSCKPYDSDLVRRFTETHFRGKVYRYQVIARGRGRECPYDGLVGDEDC